MKRSRAFPTLAEAHAAAVQESKETPHVRQESGIADGTENMTDAELAAHYDALYGVPADYDDWQPANEDGPRIVIQPDRDGYVEWDDEYETRFERWAWERRAA